MAEFSDPKMQSRAKVLNIMHDKKDPNKRLVGFSDGKDKQSARIKKASRVMSKIMSHDALRTGASLIPDLNILVERMRSKDDDSFIYLTYMLSRKSEFFTPYSLKEVSYADLPDKGQYFTMSRHGVTYWHLSENFFTPLLQWQQEFQQFLSIVKIRTFAVFRIWKGFKVWQKTVKWRKIGDARRCLEDNLFVAKPILARAILRLRSELVVLQKQTFINDSVIEEWHPFYFLETQMKVYEHMRKLLRDFRTRTLAYLYDACYGALIAYGFFPDDEINHYASVKKMREALSFMDRAKKRTFCKTLSNFLSYCDYMMFHSLHVLTIASFRKINVAMEKHSKAGPSLQYLRENLTLHEQLESARPPKTPQKPFFLADLHLLPDRIEVEPSEDVLKHIFSRISSLIVDTVTEIPNFTDDSHFQFVTEPSIMGRQEERLADKSPDLTFLLRSDGNFQRDRKMVFNFIHEAYEKASVYTQRFETIRNNYEIDTHTDPNTLSSERDLNTLRAYCFRYCNNVLALDGILSVVNLGLLKLTQSSFKEAVTPVCQNLQLVLAKYLPKLAVEEVKRLTEETLQLNEKLRTLPDTAMDLVEHIRFLDSVEEDMKKLFEQIDYAHDCFMIIKDFAIPIDSERKEDYLDCEDLINRTWDKLQEEKDKRDLFITRLDERMQEDIKAIFEEIEEVLKEAQDPTLLALSSDPTVVKERLQALRARLDKCRESANEYISYQKEFKIDITRYDQLDEAFREITMRQNVWTSLDEWEEALQRWTQSLFNTLDVEEMININTKIIKNCMQFEKYLPANDTVPSLRESAEAFKLKLPALGYLRNPNLKARHWTEIENVLGRKLYKEDGIYISSYDEVNAFDEDKATRLMEISSQATGEAQLENMLKKIDAIWKETELSIVSHHDQKDVFILAGTEELQVLLDDSTVNVNTIAASKYVAPIKAKVDEWIIAMDQFAETFEEWATCQTSWIYLEAIFSSPDIQRQLPQEAKLFWIVDKSFKEIVRNGKKVALALPVMSNAETCASLKENNKLLDQISRGLEAYLEVKRVVFPRFYFLSNDELLEILAQTRVPQAVQPHLRKCFDAIYRLEFGTKEGGDGGKVIQTNDILAFISPEGEKLLFGKGLKARGAVEEWLSKVEDAMFIAVKRYMRFGYQCYPAKERDEWFQDHPNQVVLTISQQQWAAEVHYILDNPKNNKETIHSLMKDFERKCFTNLAALAAITRKQITSLLRKVLCALITIDVHAKDSVNLLISKNVSKSTDFNWLKMLRFYWQAENDTVTSRMASANIPYYYEYLGAGGVLVLTPLTDRCYLCLMGAIQMDLGGSPAGPAGTGKTETTKDLAKAVAKQCVVFNCSDGLDYKMMGRFFSGLAQCGAWCCFDEFNRIDIEVLSVIAQQLITIRNAKLLKLKRFMFEGREIKLNPSCAVFITMNPGYAGRTELPDNLKALFRPMSMMVPDYALIAEVILYSEGFENPKILAHKMVQMYKLCSEQLSQQNHYDFGMRAVKSVLVMAGSLKRAAPNQREDITLIAALRDSNIPKFLADDALLFRGILSDLFPGVELPESSHPDLEKALTIGLTEKNLQPISTIIRKCLQLYETMCVRWGVMCVGPTGGGKTVVLRALAFALNYLYENNVDGPYFRPVTIQTMNPKAVGINELYGYVDSKTLEWQDGLLGLAVRTAVNVEEEIHQWIVNDGPVDAVWIENLNTVLDDNKMLCLANSERIKLTAWVHMLFEVQDLAQASPATVSRCGMVYVDPGNLGWLPLIDSWKNSTIQKRLSPAQIAFLYELFKQKFPTILDFALAHGAFMIHQMTSAKVLLCCELIEALCEQTHFHNLSEQQWQNLITMIFIWTILWSMASNFRDAEKEMFEQFLRSQFSSNSNVQLPTSGTLWDVRVNMETYKWETWDKILEKFVFNIEDKYFDMQVPTVDTTKYGYISELLFKRNFPVMFTGDTGVGKSVLAITTLKKLQMDNIIPVLLNFSAQTSSLRTQEMIEAPLEKRKRTQLSAPFGKTVIVFIDDVNMPKLDRYGSQPAIELLRQFLDFKGLFDREKLFWKEIMNVVLGCACAPPGGGRNPLTPRFVRHFALFALPKPNEGTLTTIFNGILTGFLNEFSSAIRPLALPMVYACVEIYERIAHEMLPTPDKSHYIFNLRDLSKCIQGILQAKNTHYNTEMEILRLFYHETTRVFHDRLINDDDKSVFKQIMDDVCVKHFNRQVVKPEEPPILYGDFIVFGRAKSDRIYEEIRDHKKLESVLMDYIEDYASVTGRAMRLILFQDAMEHIVRLARLLRSDRGNGLLVGVAGMGKQSLTKLASHLNEYQCRQIELKRNYDSSAFHEDLKVIYRLAGIQDKPTVFLMVDTQIVEEEFLEDINNILNSGEVPNLFEGDDYEKVILDAREACNAAKKDGCSRDEIYKFFINRVRNNLHVVLSMSPVGDAFRRRCRMFPSLVNCTTIDWFTNWPTEALYSVALGLLQEIAKNNDEREALASTTVFMHKTVEKASIDYYKEMKRHYYTTPSSYLELLKLYQNLLQVKTEDIIRKRKRIANGLSKILETNDIVAVMQRDLEIMVPQLDEKSHAMKELVERLTLDTRQADAVKEAVMHDENIAKEKAGVCQAISDDASKDLEIAMPALTAAEDALKSITKSDINELKSFTTPPALVQFVMEAVCILMGAKPSWAAAKQLMADVNFIKHLFEYDKEHIKDDVLKKVKKYIDHKDFLPLKLEKVSKVAKSVCLWVIAMDKFAKVYKVVEPKIKRKEAAEAELTEVMKVLKAKQMELASVEAKIQILRENLEEKKREFQIVQDSVDLTYGRINRAGRLTSALADEEVRWKETVKVLSEELRCVPGDVLVSAACVAYLGAFSNEYRRNLSKQWVEKCQFYKIPSSKTFNLLKVLGDAYEMRQWTMDGLPKDIISTENGLYATRALRWPLMIDPQEQANRWIRNKEKPFHLVVLKMTDGNLLRSMEHCLRNGLPILLEDISETIDPSIRPVLQRETFVSEGRVYIKLGDVVVDYDPNFRLYMTTKLSNPHYLPEICINVTLVNFLVTIEGLEDQLLGDIVAIELPALEKQRNDLVVKINTDKQQLLALEDKVLKLLDNSQGNILDDEELVETLNDSKETSQIIATRLIDTEETEKVITATREKYRSLASRGAILYFVVSGLAEIDPMYQYSLKYFSQIFCHVIKQDHEKMSTEDRIAQLKVDELKAIFANVSRGLFENHKIIFSFLLATAVEEQEGKLAKPEMQFLTRGVVGSTQIVAKPHSVHLDDNDWEACCYLEQYFPKAFAGFINQITTPFYLQLYDIKEVFNFTEDASREPVDTWNKHLSTFQKLMFIRNFREERFLLNVVGYLCETVGKSFTESSVTGNQLKTVYQDMMNVTPLVFILSTGSDPMAAFLKFADEMKYMEKFYSISLGQGQGPIAESLIDKSLKLGHWVFLQNCHLATSWMLRMETIIRNITLGITKAHDDFRLFLSSMPMKAFPISVLQNSVKLTNEPPKGIKANVLGALTDMNKDFFENHILKDKWRAIVFGLCMFHAVILERRKFGPLGWNILYEFSESDRECGLKTLDFFINRQIVDVIPWDAIFYINGQVTWGGRVTDYWDQRCLSTILKIFSSPPILDPDYKYCRGDPYYRDPKMNTVEEYHKYVQNFPTLEDPEIFGMNQNANIVYQSKETNFFVETLLLGQPRSAADEGQAQENDLCLEIIARIQSVLEQKVSRSIHSSLKVLDAKGQLPSLTTVLVQEIDRFNICLKIVHDSLVNLGKAIKGLVVMSEELEEVFQSLLTNVVPALWTKKSFLSIKPLPSYIADFQRRIDFIKDWAQNGNPRSYWLSGFFFPQSFLTGLLQTHARKRILPIDALKIEFKVLDRTLIQQDFFERRQKQQPVDDLYGNLPESNEAGVNVHGLFIEAARWDIKQGGLCDARQGELFCRLPTIRFIPCLELDPGNRYDAPLYKTQARSGVLSTTGHSTNFILSVLLESKFPPDYWILRGTALISGVRDNVS